MATDTSKPGKPVDVAPDNKAGAKSATPANVAAAAAPVAAGPTTGMPADVKEPAKPEPVTKAPTEAQAAVKVAEEQTQQATSAAQQQAKDADLQQQATTDALATDLAASAAPGAAALTGNTVVESVLTESLDAAHPSDMPTEEAKAEAAEKQDDVESVTVGRHQFLGQKAKLWNMLKQGAHVHEIVEALEWEAHQVIATMEAMVQMTGAKLEQVGVGAARKFTVTEPEKVDTAGM